MINRVYLCLSLCLALLALLAPRTALAGVSIADEQARALSEVNRYRQSVGLPAVTATTALNTAARKHAVYMLETGEMDHYETQENSPYYVAYSPYGRARLFGYSNSSISENIRWSSEGAVGTRTYVGVDNAVQWWMAAIYHRFAIISPRTENIGYGVYYKAGKAAQVMDFGTDYSRTGPMVRWPRPNQRGVDTSLDGESPNPVAQFGGDFHTGYPVSITWYRGTVRYTSIQMVRVSDGKVIPGYRLSPQNDDFHRWSTSLSFIPKDPLDPSTTYRVTFSGFYSPTGSTSDERSFSYTWSFTTQPPQGNLRSSSPANGSTGAALTPTIKLYFERGLRSYTLVPDSAVGSYRQAVGLSLRRSDGTNVAIDVVEPTDPYTTSVSLRPVNALSPNTWYTLYYQVYDRWGRPVRGQVRFATGG